MFVSRMRLQMFLLVLFGLMVVPALAQEKDEGNKDKDSKIEVEMVVSASRKAEKKLEAPATIETVTAEAILQGTATSIQGTIAQLKGVDYVSGGINLQRVSARGFATSFQARMLTMVNGRLATLPGAGVPQGNLVATSALDVKSMEVVLGPASALYGANASAGVFNILTKDPWDESGTSVAVKGGEQSLLDGQIRHAGIASNGKFAWKLNVQFLTAEDFDSENVYFADGSNQSTHTAAEVGYALRREELGSTAPGATSRVAWREDELGSFDVNSKKGDLNFYYKSGDYLASATYGWSSNDTFTTTNLGRNLLDGYEVEYTQLQLTHPHFYISASTTENDAGGTFGAQNVPAFLNAGLPLDSIIQDPNQALVFDASKMTDIEGQFNYAWGPVELIAGASWREFKPDSGGTYLDDGGEFPWHTPIKRTEEGYYAQIDLRLLEEKLRLTGAVRHDTSNEYADQTSPKLSMTYNAGNHNFRASWNKAHRDPSILENHLYFARVASLGNVNIALGNPVGWNVTHLATGETEFFQGLEPETVETTEVGYRGVIGGNIVIDAVYYTSDYENFISALQPIAFIADPADPAVAVRADGNYGGFGPFPGWPYVLTYLNFGNASVDGFDIGIDYYYEDSFQLNLSYGSTDLSADAGAAPSFNTPEKKIKGSMVFNNLLVEDSFLSFAGRHVGSYPYLSGRWAGTIGDYTIVDMAMGYNMKDHEMRFKLGVANLFDQNKTELIGLPALPRFITFEIQKKF
jgi:iron complex outermembrane receptor protein